MQQLKPKTAKAKPETPVRQWPTVTRTRRPYTYRPVTVHRTDGPLQLPDEDVPLMELNAPIHPHLLKLVAGNPDSFAEYVEAVGLLEFLPWLVDEDAFPLGHPESWLPVIRAHGAYGTSDLGSVSVRFRDLAAAWTDAETMTRFADSKNLLLSAYEAAAAIVEGGGVDMAAKEVLEIASWTIGAPKSELRYDEDSRRVIEVPANVFARAWLELIDGLQAGGLPIQCGGCWVPFMPSRSNKRHCSHLCQQKAYDRRYNQDPGRKEYQRMRKRWARKSITDGEWEAFQQSRKAQTPK